MSFILCGIRKSNLFVGQIELSVFVFPKVSQPQILLIYSLSRSFLVYDFSFTLILVKEYFSIHLVNPCYIHGIELNMRRTEGGI